jgi:hypothetical protein
MMILNLNVVLEKMELLQKKKKVIKKLQKEFLKLGNLYYRKDRIKKPRTKLKN